MAITSHLLNRVLLAAFSGASLFGATNDALAQHEQTPPTELSSQPASEDPPVTTESRATETSAPSGTPPNETEPAETEPLEIDSVDTDTIETDPTETAPAETASRSSFELVAPDLTQAPPLGTATGSTPITFELGAQVFGEYRLSFPAQGDWFHELDVPRMFVHGGVRYGIAMGRVVLEGTRGTGDGALSGVANDSLLVRVREAWAGLAVLDGLEIRLGMIPSLVTPTLTQMWNLRAANRIALRELGLMAPTDLGGSIVYRLPQRWGFIGVSYLNGEGYTSREINRGKNLELALEIHPLAFLEGFEPLNLFAAYSNGSLGAGASRSDRFVSQLSWNQAEWGAGFGATYVLGWETFGDREGLVLEGWARARFFDHLLVGAHVFTADRNLAEGDQLTQMTLLVGGRLTDAFRAFAAVDGRFADSVAGPRLPGWETWQVRIIVEANATLRWLGAE